MFVLDEADEMLSRGFKDQIYDVFRYMPQDIQVTDFAKSLHLDWCPKLKENLLRMAPL